MASFLTDHGKIFKSKIEVNPDKTHVLQMYSTKGVNKALKQGYSYLTNFIFKEDLA